MDPQLRKPQIYVAFQRIDVPSVLSIISRLKLLGRPVAFGDELELCSALKGLRKEERPKVVIFIGEGNQRKQHLEFARTILIRRISTVVFVHRNNPPRVTSNDDRFVNAGKLIFIPDLDISGTLSERIYMQVKSCLNM